MPPVLHYLWKACTIFFSSVHLLLASSDLRRSSSSVCLRVCTAPLLLALFPCCCCLRLCPSRYLAVALQSMSSASCSTLLSFWRFVLALGSVLKKNTLFCPHHLFSFAVLPSGDVLLLLMLNHSLQRHACWNSALDSRRLLIRFWYALSRREKVDGRVAIEQESWKSETSK